MWCVLVLITEAIHICFLLCLRHYEGKRWIVQGTHIHTTHTHTHTHIHSLDMTVNTCPSPELPLSVLLLL